MTRNIRQTVLPFKLETMESDDKLTSLGGIPLLHEIFHKMRLSRVIRRKLKLKTRGWTESEMLEAAIALVASGGEHMDDMNILLSEKGYQQVIGKEGLPSAKALERFLKKFHDAGLMKKKPDDATAWVPDESMALRGLGQISRYAIRRLIQLSSLQTVTIENDATAVFSQKENALGTYKGGTGYMPVVGTIAELGIVIADEFRDGNVPPGFEVKRFFKVCEKSLPQSVKKIRTRLDGAYYEHDLMDYLDKRKIEFTITAEKRKGFLDWVQAIPEGSWKPLMKITDKGETPTGREWTELDWVSAQGTRRLMDKRTRRYLITRKTEKQWEMFQDEASEEVTEKDRYEATVTNMDWRGDRLIRWHNERAGSIEHTLARLKNDLAGGVLPCAEFGANAAWWRIQCMALNMVRALQLHALPEKLSTCRLKKLRLWLFNIAGRITRTARGIILKINGNHPSFEIYREARRLIANMSVP